MINFKQFQFLTSFLLVVFVLSTASFAQDTSQVLSLEDCINIALEKNSTLRVSRFSDEAANKDVLGSYSGILPTISVSANKGNRISGPAEYLGDVQVDTNETGGAIYDQRVITAPRTEREYNSASLSIDQNIFDGGIWWNKIRKAKTDKESSKFNLLGQLNDVVLQVQQAYFNLNKQIKLLEVYEVAVTRSQAQLDRTEKMYELGATAQLDVFQARVNLGNDRILLLQQKNTLDQAKKDLNLVMGQDPFTPLQISTDINLKTDIQDSEELIQIALENHPTIKQDEANIKSNGLSVSLAKGSYYPRLYGYVDYQRSNEDLSRVYKNYDKNYTVTYGVGLSLNIFKGFSDYVSVQKAKIAEKTAKENFED
jgi:outer membrane protein